ncbi:unnamed protein product [Ixodes pacificus]
MCTCVPKVLLVFQNDLDQSHHWQWYLFSKRSADAPLSQTCSKELNNSPRHFFHVCSEDADPAKAESTPTAPAEQWKKPANRNPQQIGVLS